MKTIKIGTATLIHGDCEEFMKDLPDKCFSLACVDPPYGIGEDGGKNRTKMVRQKNGSSIKCFDGSYKKKLWDSCTPESKYFDDLVRVSGNQIIWGINYMPVLMLGGGVIVWDKMNDGSDQSDAEIAFCSLNKRVDIVRYLWRGMFQGLDINSVVQQGNKMLNEKRIHPTQKPVKLYEWIYANYAKPGQAILDTHGGSMSSVIAALNMGFEITCIEKDEDYFNAAVERVIKSQQQQKLF